MEHRHCQAGENASDFLVNLGLAIDNGYNMELTDAGKRLERIGDELMTYCNVLDRLPDSLGERQDIARADLMKRGLDPMGIAELIP